MFDSYVFPEDTSLPERFALTAIGESAGLPEGTAFERAELPDELKAEMPNASQALVWRVGSVPGYETPHEWALAQHGEEELSPEAEALFANLEAQMRTPSAETLPGTSLDANELTIASHLIHYMKSYAPPKDSPYEVGEIVVRNKLTGELVGAVVRTDTDEIVYSKD